MKIQFDTAHRSADDSNGLAVRYAAAKRQVPRWRWYLLLAAVLALPAYFAVRFVATYWWETVPGVIVVDQIVLRIDSAGKISSIANAGQRLKAGDALVTFEPTATATSGTVIGPRGTATGRPGEIERIAQQQLALQQERLRTVQALHDQGAATRQEVDSARLQELQARTELSRARVDVLGGNQTNVGSASVVPSATRPVVTAPFDATVIRPLVRAGEWVPIGTEVIVLQGTAPPEVQAYVTPDAARYAKIGQQATLRFMDGGRLRARITNVIAEAERLPAERVSSMAPRRSSIVVQLQPLEPLPEEYRIHNLPLDVRFDSL